MNNQLINKIINYTKKGSDIDPKLLKQNLAMAQKTLNERRRIEFEIKEMEEEMSKYKVQIRKMESEMQTDCSHMITTYYPDASGNNDSETVCDLCGKEVRRR